MLSKVDSNWLKCINLFFKAGKIKTKGLIFCVCSTVLSPDVCWAGVVRIEFPANSRNNSKVSPFLTITVTNIKSKIKIANMVNTFSDMAVDSLIPILSDTHSIVKCILLQNDYHNLSENAKCQVLLGKKGQRSASPYILHKWRPQSEVLMTMPHILGIASYDSYCQARALPSCLVQRHLKWHNNNLIFTQKCLNKTISWSGTTAEYSPHYNTAARLVFKSCLRRFGLA